MPFGIAGFAHERLRLLGIEAKPDLGVVREHARGDPGCRGNFAAMQNRREDAAIHRQRERLAHAHIVEWFSIGDKTVVVAA